MLSILQGQTQTMMHDVHLSTKDGETSRLSRLMLARILLAVCVCAPLAFSSICFADSSAHNETLDAGYRDMYNLDFAAAHQTFQRWQQLHPEDPIGFASDAAAYLFSEFDRLHVLEAELFTDNKKFEARKKLKADPAVRGAFDANLAKVDQLTANILSHTPGNGDALFAQVLANGLRGDYAAMIDKRNTAGLNYMKTARALAETLLQQQPQYYDAYLAIGVENYLLGNNVAPVRWFLHLTGAETDKQEGIERLKLTAAKGHYLAPFARLLLAVSAIRDKDTDTARQLLSGLAQEFPNNQLYARELERLSDGSL
jgi:hypothetical protein